MQAEKSSPLAVGKGKDSVSSVVTALLVHFSVASAQAAVLIASPVTTHLSQAGQKACNG